MKKILAVLAIDELGEEGVEQFQQGEAGGDDELHDVVCGVGEDGAGGGGEREGVFEEGGAGEPEREEGGAVGF